MYHKSFSEIDKISEGGWEMYVHHSVLADACLVFLYDHQMRSDPVAKTKLRSTQTGSHLRQEPHGTTQERVLGVAPVSRARLHLEGGAELSEYVQL